MKYFSNRDKNTFFMTNEIKKTSYQLIFDHIFRKKHFKDNLENFMPESLNATSTPLINGTLSQKRFLSL
jgi:hypothetical protein